MKKTLFCMALSFSSLVGFAQKVKFTKDQIKEMEHIYFAEPFLSASTKKTSTAVLKNGEIHVGYISDIKAKKGQIYSFEIKDSITSKVNEYTSTDVAELYVFPKNMESGMKASKYFTNIRNIGTKDLKSSISKGGRVAYINETASLKNKKEEKEFMMQKLNPEFDKYIVVFNDPRAKETNGFAVGGGLELGGGVIKSYYIKKDGEVFWLTKSDFKENYQKLFGDNAQFMKQYPYDSVEWGYLSFLILKYTQLRSEQEG